MKGRARLVELGAVESSELADHFLLTFLGINYHLWGSPNPHLWHPKKACL